MRSLASRALTLAVVALACVANACDGDDTPPSFFDGGGDAPADSTVDAPSDASDASTAHAKILAVHATPDVAAFRLCFGVGLQNDGSDAVTLATAPAPKTAFAPGAGGALPDLGDLSQKAVTPYVVLASAITSAATCDALLAADAGLASGTDYFVLPTIKNGTFAAATTTLLAITGCLPTSIDSSADITTCGLGYDGAKGNLTGRTFALDRVIGNSQRFGVQLAHVASPATGVWTALYNATTVNAVLHPFDGGADEVIAQGITLDTLAPTSAASLSMPLVDQTSIIVSAVNPDGGAPATEAAIPLPLVYEATTGQPSGENAYFVAGANYTFVFVGDPRAPTTLDGGAFNGNALHLLAFPNDPTIPSP